jgi:hypothetical protein
VVEVRRETVESDLIRAKRVPDKRLLRVGEEVRLQAGGPWHRVERVTPTAAYLKPLYSTPKQVVLPGGRSFTAHTGGNVISISPTSFVVERRGP